MFGLNCDVLSTTANAFVIIDLSPCAALAQFYYICYDKGILIRPDAARCRRRSRPEPHLGQLALAMTALVCVALSLAGYTQPVVMGVVRGWWICRSRVNFLILVPGCSAGTAA